MSSAPTTPTNNSSSMSASPVPTSPGSSTSVQPEVVQIVRTTRTSSSSSARTTALQRFMMGTSAQKKKKTLPSPQPHQQPKGNNSNGKPTYSSSSSPPAPAYNPNVTAETSLYAYLYPGAGSTEKKAQPYDEVTAQSSKPFDTGCISLVMSGKNVLVTKPRPGQKSKAVRGKPPVTIGPPKDASIVVCAGAKVSKPATKRQKQPEQQRRQQQPRSVLSTGYRGTARPPAQAMSNENQRPSQKLPCSTGAAFLPAAQINTSTRSATPDSTRKQHRSSPSQKAVSNKRSRQASAVAEDDDSESEQDVRSASKRRRFARRYSDKEADTIIASVEDDEPTSSTSSTTTTTSPAKQQSPATDKKSTTGKTTPPPPCKGVAVYASGHRSSRAASKGSSSPKSNFFHKGERLASNPFIKA